MSSYTQTRYTYTPDRAVVWREIARYLQDSHGWVKPDARILELGCGYGDWIGQMRGSRRLALDYDTTFADYLARYAGVEQQIGDSLESLQNLTEASFDTILASNFFEHFPIESVQAHLEETKRVLTPTGRLIAIQPNFNLCAPYYFDDWTHRTAFSHTAFADLVSACGFRVLACEPGFLPFSFKSRLPVSAWLTWLYLRLPFRPLAAQFLLIAEKSSAPTAEASENTYE